MIKLIIICHPHLSPKHAHLFYFMMGMIFIGCAHHNLRHTLQNFSSGSSFSNPHPEQKQHSQGLDVSLSFASHHPLLQPMYPSLSVKNQRSRSHFLSLMTSHLLQDSSQCSILSETGRLSQWCSWSIFKQRLHNPQVKKQSASSACNSNTTRFL